jgi:hypothetical protein
MGGERELLQLPELIQLLKTAIQTFPDKRKGSNCHYTFEDICLSGFSVFFTQSPSFLSHQRTMKNALGMSNANTIFGITKIPTDNHVRMILDEVAPDHVYGVFDEVLNRLEMADLLQEFRSFQNELLLAIDGTQYYSSQTISCPHCSKRQQQDGSILYYHMLLAPAIVSPRLRKAIALAPEFLAPQQGKKKQDHELAAAKRWLERMGNRLSPLGVTLLGDDLYSNQPFCSDVLEEDLNFLFVCKPKSHQWLYEWLTIQHHEGEMQTGIRKRKEKGTVRIYTYRFTNEVPLRDSEDALLVNWAEVTVREEATGKEVYKNAFITNHLIHEENIEGLIEAGRARWKIENENNNTLKTKGYHLEHNFGHGKKYLSQTLAVLNILAFLFHTILSFTDKRYQLMRDTLPRRDMFFQDIAALFRYMLFSDWDHLLLHMLTAFELEDPG